MGSNSIPDVAQYKERTKINLRKDKKWSIQIDTPFHIKVPFSYSPILFFNKLPNFIFSLSKPFLITIEFQFRITVKWMTFFYYIITNGARKNELTNIKGDSTCGCIAGCICGSVGDAV